MVSRYPRFCALTSLVVGQVLALKGEDFDVASLSLDELLEVEVTTPGKVPEEIRDTPASVYLVSRDDIETFGYNSLTEVLENVPGFYNIDNLNGVSGNFGVRGYWNGRSQNSSMAILVNGVPQMRPDLFSTPMEGINVPVEAIDRIEVSRGPNSVFYGNGAFFGAINIITDASFNDDQLRVTYGSLGTKRVSLRKSFFGEDFHIIFNGGQMETDGHDFDLLEMVGSMREPLLAGFGVTEGNSSLDGRLEQETAFLQLSAAWRQVYFEASVNDSDVEGYSGFPSVEDGNLRKSQIARFTIGWDQEFGDFRLDTKLSYQDYESAERFDALFPGFYGVNDREFNNWEFESLLSYSSSEPFQFVLGVNAQKMLNFLEYTDVPAVGLPNESVVIDERCLHSIFGQASYRLSEAWQIVGGYRLEEMASYDRLVFLNSPTPLPQIEKGDFKNGTPKFSVIYQPSESQVFKLMVADAIKIPNFAAQDFESERSRTVELNYVWSGESTLFSASVFHNSLSDLLIETLDIEPTGLIDTDLLSGGEVKSTGVEVLVRSEFTDTLRGEVGFTYQDSVSGESPDGALSYSPDFVAQAKLTYRKDDFSISTVARCVSEMSSFYNLEGDSPLLRGGYFGEPTDSYCVADVNARLDNVWGDTYLALQISNLFDTEIRYPNNPINGLLLDRGNLGYGRRVFLSAGVKF